MKRILLLIIILFTALSSFAQEGVTVDSLKKDTTKKAVIPADTLKYIPRDPKNPKKAIVKITSGINDLKSSKSKPTPAKKTGAKSMSMSMSMAASIDAGRTPTAIDVSPSGAATYTVPISVAPGINGVVPKLALVYNSQSGNGLAGYGWNLSGLSSITRIARTLFHDDTVGGVNGNLNDRFALDGQRLILKNGTYGADGAEYQTENYSNTKIVSHGSMGTNMGPAYFDVYYPDGSHAVYGQDSTSRTKTSYAINYMDNPQNIRISYVYTKAYEVSLISQIAYGALSSGTAINQVNFTYNSRYRAQQSYVGGTPIFQYQILNQIDVVGNGTGYRTYALTQDTVAGLRYEQITSIQEISGDGTKAFEPINFYYGDDFPSITVTASTDPNLSGVNSSNSGVLTGDFNGNGKMDIVVYPLSQKNKFWIKWDPNKNLDPKFTDTVKINFETMLTSTYLDANNKVVTGQGLVLIQQPAADTIKFKTYKPDTLGTTLQYERTWIAPMSVPCYATNTNKIPRSYFSGDFNGDGLTDVISVTQPYYRPDNYGGCWIRNGTPDAYFINLDRRVTSNFVHFSGMLKDGNNAAAKITTGDFNGDGKTDLLHIAPGRMRVYSLNENNQLVQLDSIFDSSSIGADKISLIGDFNGDGKTDIMFSNSFNSSGNMQFAVFTATGKSFVKTDKTYPFAYKEFVTAGGYVDFTTLIASDVNGDGKTDVISCNTVTNNSHVGSATAKVYINTNADVVGAPEFALLLEKTGVYFHLDNYPIPLFLDNNQTNFELEFGLLSDNTITQFSSDQDMKKIRQLKMVIQDAVMYNIDYQDAMHDPDDPNAIYQGDTKQVYPYVNTLYAPDLKVVSKLKRNFGMTPVMQLFNYRSLVSNMVGLGNLGFTETIRSNWMEYGNDNDPNKIFTTNIHDPLLRGALVRSFTSKARFTTGTIKNKPGTVPDTILSAPVTTAKTVVAAHSIRLLPGFRASGANGTFIAKLDDPVNGIADGSNIDVYITRTDYTYQTELLSSKVFINKPTTVITKDLLNKTSKLAGYGYDGYYNMNHQSTRFSGDGTKTVDYVFDNNTTSWYFGRPTKKTEVSTISGDNFSTEEEYTYNGVFVEQIKRRGNGSGLITEDYEPDAFGNVKKKTVTVSGDAPRIVSMQYDASGRFNTKITDVLGQETNMAYNSSNGTLSSLTNPFGQTTNYTYDAWGRETQTEDYKTNKTYTTYTTSGSGNIEIVKEDDEQRRSTTLVNALGQTEVVITRDVLGQDVWLTYQHDAYGRLISQSEPGASQLNTTEYDGYGRPTTLTSYTGKTTSISYNGLQTTVNDGTKNVVTTRDAMGNVKSVTDPGGTINYTYFGNGNLKSTNYDGSGQTIEQDAWGRKTKLTDPSAGVYTYTYNGFDQPLTQTTPKGTTTYTYLADGRLSTKHIVSSNTDMAYTYGYNSDKLLATVGLTDTKYNNNINYTYGYDSDKRLESVIEDNPQARFTKTLTYNDYEQVATETNEAKNKSNNITVSKTITNVYEHGQVKKITSGASTVWEVTAQDAYGHVTTALLGANIKQTHTYDGYGLPQNFLTEKLISGSSPVPLIELGYSFNATTGNLSSRTNSTFNPTPGNPLSEGFTYDNLDRLTVFNETGATNRTQNYDTRGRITNNGQVGDYTYSGASYQQSKLTNLTDFARYHYQPSQKRQLQQITYNAFKAPVSINEEGRERIDFEYNGAEQRSHMYYGDTATAKTARPFVRHYSEDGSMEITENKVTGKTSFIFYLGGDAYTAPAIWKYEQTGTTVNTDKLYYLLRDHLSSIVMIINDTGRVEEKRHFDAWGNIVQTGGSVAAFSITDRGYTGHEHLQGVGLINMNARLYDPILHRFLAPDDLIQDPYNTQDYNRYVYALNNPLKYIDPNGNSIWPWDWGKKKDKDPPPPKGRVEQDGSFTLEFPNPHPSSGDYGSGGGFGGGDFGNCCGFDYLGNNSSGDNPPFTTGPYMPVGSTVSNTTRSDNNQHKHNIFGNTNTFKTGVEFEINTAALDKITYSQYKVIKTGTKKYINFNTTTVINQRGVVKISSSVVLSLSKLSVIFSNDGIQHRFGDDALTISIGISTQKGLTTGFSSNGYEYNSSIRPGGMVIGAGLAVGAAIIYPPSMEFTIPGILKLIAH